MNEIYSKLIYFLISDVIIGVFSIYFMRYAVKISQDVSLNDCKYTESDLEKIIDHPCIHEISADESELLHQQTEAESDALIGDEELSILN